MEKKKTSVYILGMMQEHRTTKRPRHIARWRSQKYDRTKGKPWPFIQGT